MAAFTSLNGGSPNAMEVASGPPEIVVEAESDDGGDEVKQVGAEVSSSHQEVDGWDKTTSLSYASTEKVEGAHKHKRKWLQSEDELERDAGHNGHNGHEHEHSSPLSRRESREALGPLLRDLREYAEDERGAASLGLGGAVLPAYAESQVARHRWRESVPDQDDDDDNQSPEGDDRGAAYAGQYTPEQRRDGVIQSDPKKRKRNFSNRTKTGCWTCRKRKKKCDEAKPECNNCSKGGFLCQGYPQQKGVWPKPENKPQQISIESKDPNYVPPGAYGMPQQAPYINSPPAPQQQQQKRDSLPYNRGQPLRIDPPQGRLVHSDDDRTGGTTATTLASALTTSPDHKLSAMSAYTNQTNAFPTPISAATPGSAFADRTPKDYQRVPPLHDLTRTNPEAAKQSTSLPPPPSAAQGTTLPQITGILLPPRPESPVPSSGGAAQASAQLALSHTQFPGPGPRKEKDEMVNGRPYRPSDKGLMLDRERCGAACWRFNNAANPNLGVSPGERARLFRDIVGAGGCMGAEVEVSAPFNCDYGWNISIGSNVLIGRNLFVNDAAEVRIGNNVIISPNVCIYTGSCSTDPRQRDGVRGHQIAKAVEIQDDVWIAANAIILPGVTIGRGATVACGSIVSKDVQKYSIYMPLRAKHVRQINFV